MKKITMREHDLGSLTFHEVGNAEIDPESNPGFGWIVAPVEARLRGKTVAEGNVILSWGWVRDRTGLNIVAGDDQTLPVGGPNYPGTLAHAFTQRFTVVDDDGDEMDKDDVAAYLGEVMENDLGEPYVSDTDVREWIAQTMLDHAPPSRERWVVGAVPAAWSRPLVIVAYVTKWGEPDVSVGAPSYAAAGNLGAAVDYAREQFEARGGVLDDPWEVLLTWNDWADMHADD